ncbi:MAG TPA: sigma-70 family RNA polymerase sigma factor [Pirellulales bacterium]|nr:sigma-70 family RNA polymerase sigma factor [Pirellulales bacterium]
MSAVSLDQLLKSLADRDPDAVEKVFLNVAPGLRALVRRRISGALRAKFDSEDVVISVWTDLVEGFREGRWSFSSAAQLRAFLVTATRRRLIDRVRQHRAQLEHERVGDGEHDPSLVAGGEAKPSELARAGELWERLLALCPPAHHELLNLKRQGLPLAEIASRTGLHPSSVRRILYDLAKRLAVAERTPFDAAPASRGTA